MGKVRHNYEPKMVNIGQNTLAEYLEKNLLESLLNKFSETISGFLKVNQLLLFSHFSKENVLKVIFSKGFEGTDQQKYSTPPGRGIVGKVFLQKQLYVRPPNSPINIFSREPNGCLYVPMTFDQFDFGVAVICSNNNPRFFSVSELEKVSILANHVAYLIQKDLASLSRPNLSPFISILLDMMKAKHEYLFYHSMHAAKHCTMIARYLGLPQNKLETINKGALLHDLGQVVIPDNILLCPSPLSANQFTVIKKHPSLGVTILGIKGLFGESVPMILHHHERYDGHGYPHGLKGSEIPIEARILAVVDSFQAMISNRPYRKSLSVESAANELKQKAGSQFDPNVVRAFFQGGLHSFFTLAHN